MERNGWHDEECKEILEEQSKVRLKMLKGKHEVIFKPTKRHIGKQEKHVGRRKNTMKRKNSKNYKRNIKEIDWNNSIKVFAR